MFCYYGRKKRIAGFYPDPMPESDTIIEPFAGSAAYSLHDRRWEKKVILIERDPQVAALWRWLINEATPEEVLAMPDLVPGQMTDQFLHLLCMASKRTFTYKKATVTPIMANNWIPCRNSIARDLHKVKHWTIIEGDYSEAPDIEATWFIDPPYQGEPGTGYRWGSSRIDYAALARWTEARRGEVLVCEGPDATWLPFKPLLTQHSVAGKMSEEVLFYRSPRPEVAVLNMF